MTSSGEQPLGSGKADPDDADEVARLKAELEQLRASTPTKQKKDRRGWWRPIVAGLLVTVVALLAPACVLATWARDQVADTDRYLETVTPLASDPAVQQAIASRVEEVVFGYLDVETATNQLVAALSRQDLPPQVVLTLRAAAEPLAAGIRGFVSDRILELVQSDAFEEAWVAANRAAHDQLVAVLTGEGSEAVNVDSGSVSINLAAVITAVKAELTQRGFGIADRIPVVRASYTLVQSDDLAKVQGLFSLLDGLATWLPVVALLLLALAIVVARDHRRTTVAAGVAVAFSMLILGATLNIVRPFYLDALPADVSTDAAAAIYDQLVYFIRLALRAVLVVALTVAVVAWLWAPSGSGAAVRRGIVRGIDGIRSGRSRAGLRTGAFGTALAEYRTPIRVGIVGLAALIYLLQDHPTGATALTVVVVTAVLLLVIEVLAAGPATSETQPGGNEAA